MHIFSFMGQIFSMDPLPVGAKKQYDHKVDVYSFSIVLWELMTNQTPFKGRNNVMVAYATAKVSHDKLFSAPHYKLESHDLYDLLVK